MHRSILLAVCCVAGTLPVAVAACGERPYAVVSDWLEAADDASRTGDFAAALAYANSARQAADSLHPAAFAACGRKIADVRYDQFERRNIYVAKNGRSPAAFATAMQIAPVFPKDFNCP